MCGAEGGHSMTLPLVSVLLCTHNSRELLPIAIDSYLSQNYPNRELVVVDDGDDLIEDMVKDIPNVQYHLFPARVLSQKRNAGIRFARGGIITHFDSDDWSGPERITNQVDFMFRGNFKVVGYNKAYWYDIRKKITTYASCGVWGAALTYNKAWALKHPWNETQCMCEDVLFLNPVLKDNLLGAMNGDMNFVALAHSNNAERPFGQIGWEIISNDCLPNMFKMKYL